MELINFVTGLGYPIVAAGKGKNNPLNIDATPDLYMEEAKRRNMNPRMLVEFVDGSKTMVEMAAIANATGLVPDCPGMHGPAATLTELEKVLCPKADGGVLSRKGVVDYSIGKGVAPGVFVIAEMAHPRVRERMHDLKLGPGPYYTFYRPYHLTSLEVPLSCARAVLYKMADMQPLDVPTAEVCAVAKKDLEPGERIDAIGEYTYRAWIMTVEDAVQRQGRSLRPARGRQGDEADPQGRAPHLCRIARWMPAPRIVALRKRQDDMLKGTVAMNAVGSIKPNARPFYQKYSAAELKEALRKMYLIRRFEEGAEEAYMRGLIHGTMHLSIGQEASAVGSTMALRNSDYITSTHRGHGHCIGKGADPKLMFAEFFGKEEGYCRGRGGSMHIADVATGNLGANGIVGGGLPIAVGAALAIKKQKRDDVAMCFFGDGASNEGAFHEALNMAAIWKLPVVFVCENNKYGMSVSTERSMAVANVADRASAYNMPGVIVDGNAIADVEEAIAEAIARARARRRPDPRRMQDLPHARPFPLGPQPLPHQGRDRGVEGARPHSALRDGTDGAWHGHRGRSRGHPRVGRGRDRRRHRVRPQRHRPQHRRSDPRRLFARGRLMSVRELTYAQAIQEALAQAMDADPNVFLMGEDIGVYGGAFQVTGDLVHRYGEDRVMDAPISELGQAGVAVGAALAGCKPVLEFQFSDFATLAMEQIVNQAAKLRFMLGGKVNVPLVMRFPAGSGTGAAAQHSQSLDAWLAHVPGLKVVQPSTPADVKGMLLAAIDDPDPGHGLRAQASLQDEGRGAGGALPHPHRQGACGAQGP